jgi:hypothetical protein
MNTCPHCKAAANPARLMIITRKSPYSCPRCSGVSRLAPKHNTVAALLTFVGVAFAAIALIQGFGFPTAIISFVIAYALVGLVMWLFMRLEPCEGEKER